MLWFDDKIYLTYIHMITMNAKKDTEANIICVHERPQSPDKIFICPFLL